MRHKVIRSRIESLQVGQLLYNKNYALPVMIFKGAIVLFSAINAVFADIPLVTCKFKDPKVDACFKEFIEDTLPWAAKEGIPELGVPSADPFLIPRVSSKLDSTLVKGALDVKDVILEGISDIKIIRFKSDLKNLPKALVDLETFHPRLFLKGQYNGGIKFWGLSLDGDGAFTLELKDVTSRVKIGLDLIKKDGNQYFKLFRVAIKPTPLDFKITATNLTPNNPKKGEEGLAMINKHWAKFYHDFYPYIEKVVDEYASKILNQYLEHIPLSPD